MNLIKRINQMESSMQDDFYQILTRFFDSIEEYTDIVNEVIFKGFEDNINLVGEDRIKIIEIIKKFCLLDESTTLDLNAIDSCRRIKLNFGESLLNICNHYIRNVSNLIDEKLAKECMPYMNSKKDLELLMKRRLFLLNKYKQTIMTLKGELFEDFLDDMIEFMYDYSLDSIVENPSCDNQNINEIIDNIPEEIIIENTFNEIPIIRKIFDYKNMKNLASNNGYIYKWSNGDHNIFEHPITNRIIVIPNHTLGLGLSIKIQKQIYKNKEPLIKSLEM